MFKDALKEVIALLRTLIGATMIILFALMIAIRQYPKLIAVLARSMSQVVNIMFYFLFFWVVLVGVLWFVKNEKLPQDTESEENN